jgi:DmsE family decaheme c-type cytochrome
VRYARILCAAMLLSAMSARAEEPQPSYVGDAACAGCHPDVQAKYAHTVHAKLFNPQNAITAEMKLGCEGCHGPSSLHVEGNGKLDAPGFISFKAVDPGRIEIENGVCLGCHRRGEQTLWKGSIHQLRDVACSSCHNVMEPISDRHLLQKKDQIDTCTSCHPTVRAQLYRRSHMPTRPGFLPDREGKMECSSCHNPHGSVADHLLKANTVNDGCYECHADKRGPFMHEHAPVTENCLNCHQPHGSTQPFMLKQAAPRLCQQCHIFSRHPSTPYAPESRFVVGASCQNCHVNIHGSNHPSGAYFLR